MNYDKSLWSSFMYAVEGIWHALKNNRNFRIEVFLGVLAVLLGLYLQITALEMVIVILVILLVILSEMVNTSLEEMVNLITSEHKKEAKIAKDVAAGMVLVAAAGSAVIGFLIFTPYISKLFN